MTKLLKVYCLSRMRDYHPVATVTIMWSDVFRDTGSETEIWWFNSVVRILWKQLNHVEVRHFQFPITYLQIIGYELWQGRTEPLTNQKSMTITHGDNSFLLQKQITSHQWQLSDRLTSLCVVIRLVEISVPPLSLVSLSMEIGIGSQPVCCNALLLTFYSVILRKLQALPASSFDQTNRYWI